MQAVLSVTVMLVNLFVAVMQVTVSVAFLLLEVSTHLHTRQFLQRIIFG